MPDPSSPERRPRRREDVVFRRVAGDWLLFDPRTRRIHVLNLSAALVWSFCTGEHDVGEIVRRVVEAFEEGAEPRVEEEPGLAGEPGPVEEPAGRAGEPGGATSAEAVERVLDRFRSEGLLRAEES